MLAPRARQGRTKIGPAYHENPESAAPSVGNVSGLRSAECKVLRPGAPLTLWSAMFWLRFASTFAAVAAALSVSCKEGAAPAKAEAAELPAAVAAAASGSASAAPKALPEAPAAKGRPEGACA